MFFSSFWIKWIYIYIYICINKWGFNHQQRAFDLWMMVGEWWKWCSKQLTKPGFLHSTWNPRINQPVGMRGPGDAPSGVKLARWASTVWVGVWLWPKERLGHSELEGQGLGLALQLMLDFLGTTYESCDLWGPIDADASDAEGQATATAMLAFGLVIALRLRADLNQVPVRSLWRFWKHSVFEWESCNK